MKEIQTYEAAFAEFRYCTRTEKDKVSILAKECITRQEALAERIVRLEKETDLLNKACATAAAKVDRANNTVTSAFVQLTAESFLRESIQNQLHEIQTERNIAQAQVDSLRLEILGLSMALRQYSQTPTQCHTTSDTHNY